MASQSLYRKWRSQTFGELVGQEPIIHTLKNALKTNNIAHAYLFTGPRGTGKTSTARLLAKTINCLNLKDGEPCNTCDQCREITAGSSFNVIEIDAASNRGIDSIRELREKVMMPPTTGKYKVYILDEAHMLTVEAFNALLKTLEEPPPHAIFVMATTDVHKMLPTVLSRCQRFDFKRITTRQIVEHLRFVAEQEHVQLEAGAAELIARAASGGMRDALSLLDQAIAYSGQHISLAQVQAMLGVADPHAIPKFITHIANLDSATGLHLIHELAEAGADLRQLNFQIAEYCRAMMLTTYGANVGEILDYTADEVREITQLARLFAPDELTEFARTFAQNELVQRSQATPQLGLELAFLACIELHRNPHSSSRSASARPGAPAAPPPSRPAPPASPAYNPPPRPAPTYEREQPPASSNGREPTPAQPTPTTPPPAQVPPPAPASPPPAPAAQAKPESATPANDLPDWDTLSYRDDEEDAEPAPTSNVTPIRPQPAPAAQPPAPPQPEPSPAPTLTIDDVREKWELIKRRVKTRKDGPKIAAILNGYVIAGVDGNEAPPTVLIRANMDFHYKSLHQNTQSLESIEWAMKIELAQPCQVRLLPPGQGGLGQGASIPPPPPASSPLSNMAASAPPRQSAYRERPAAPSPAPPPQQRDPGPASQRRADPPQSSVASATRPAQNPPLARTAQVRENTTSVAPAPTATPQQLAEQLAKSNQVLKEAVRIFKADIKDIQPK